MINDLDLDMLHQKLEEELTRVQGHIEASTGKSQRAGKNLDRDDLAHNFSSQERFLALRHVEESKVAQIKEALERITDGTYGSCANCGKGIDPDRLEIIPYATLCISCQQQNEQI